MADRLAPHRLIEESEYPTTPEAAPGQPGFAPSGKLTDYFKFDPQQQALVREGDPKTLGGYGEPRVVGGMTQRTGTKPSPEQTLASQAVTPPSFATSMLVPEPADILGGLAAGLVSKPVSKVAGKAPQSISQFIKNLGERGSFSKQDIAKEFIAATKKPNLPQGRGALTTPTTPVPPEIPKRGPGFAVSISTEPGPTRMAELKLVEALGVDNPVPVIRGYSKANNMTYEQAAVALSEKYAPKSVGAAARKPTQTAEKMAASMSKKVREVEGHHPIGFDTIEKLDYHLRNLPEAIEAPYGISSPTKTIPPTIKDIPTKEHTKITAAANKARYAKEEGSQKAIQDLHNAMEDVQRYNVRGENIPENMFYGPRGLERLENANKMKLAQFYRFFKDRGDETKVKQIVTLVENASKPTKTSMNKEVQIELTAEWVHDIERQVMETQIQEMKDAGMSQKAIDSAIKSFVAKQNPAYRGDWHGYFGDAVFPEVFKAKKKIKGMQVGGEVKPGQPVIVGETGPELLVTAQDGKALIVPLNDPNNALSTGIIGGGGYSAGQFDTSRNETSGVKLNSPEPDTKAFLDQKRNDILHPERWNTPDSAWDKRCEWWLKNEISGL